MKRYSTLIETTSTVLVTEAGIKQLLANAEVDFTGRQSGPGSFGQSNSNKILQLYTTTPKVTATTKVMTTTRRYNRPYVNYRPQRPSKKRPKRPKKAKKGKKKKGAWRTRKTTTTTTTTTTTIATTEFVPTTEEITTTTSTTTTTTTTPRKFNASKKPTMTTTTPMRPLVVSQRLDEDETKPTRLPDNDRTKFCGPIRSSPDHVGWLEQSNVSIQCGQIRGRLQVCQILCPDGRLPSSGQKEIKCFVFKGGRASLSKMNNPPVC